MIIYEIKKTDFDFLINNFQNKNLIEILNNSIDFEKSSKIKNVIFLKINENDVKNLLEELGNILILRGLNDNDEPNEDGYYIEKLIDLFNKKLYDR